MKRSGAPRMAAVAAIAQESFPWAPRRPGVAKEAAWTRDYKWLLTGVDMVTLAVAVLASFSGPVGRDLTLSLDGRASLSYAVVGFGVWGVWVAFLGGMGSRDARFSGAGMAEYQCVLKASLYVFGTIAIGSYAFKAELSRSLFVLLLPLGVLLLLLGRWSTRQTINALRRHKGMFLTSTLVVGESRQVERILADLAGRVEASYRPDAVCVLDGLPGRLPAGAAGIPVIDPSVLLDTAADGVFEAVVVAEGVQSSLVKRLAWQLEQAPTELLLTPRMVDVAGPRIHVRDAQGLSLLHVDVPHFVAVDYALKRAFDIFTSVVALVVLSPLMAVIAFLIWHEDHGPVIFRQQRIGRNGVPFTIHKFRSMRLHAEDEVQQLIADSGGLATFFKLKDDPRVTKVGAVLRKYSLDELPQFWTVLKGSMSVVGPRPQVAREVAEYTTDHHRRLLTKPGITGLWQINGRSDLSAEEGMRLDLRYVENWSLLGDAVIIAKTVATVVRASGAY